jgi:hypothetical protein
LAKAKLLAAGCKYGTSAIIIEQNQTQKLTAEARRKQKALLLTMIR